MSFLNPKRRPLSWKPQRKGLRYCSPACGRGCTWVEYQEAMQRAKAMLKLVKGKGWRIDVWENYSWHYRITNGGLQVNESASAFGKPKYWCLLSEGKQPGGGAMFWTDSEHGYYRTPMLAVNAQLKRATGFVEFLQDGLNQLKARLNK